ncbi:MAG: hypothetical protein GXY13_10655 [Acidimicrobiales bacterium]|nr:hypothetical protein [Acidimicrobiales bacterium]
MPRPHRSRPRRHGATDPLRAADLGPLARSIVDDPPAPDDELANAVIRAARDGDQVELGVLPVPTHIHPGRVLLGQVAPPEWQVVGVSAPAVIHGSGTDEPGQFVALADRAGGLHFEMSGVALGGLAPDAVIEGTIVDVLHRVLGLPTPPPRRGPLLAWSLWAADEPHLPCLSDLLPHADAAEPEAWGALRAWLAAPGDHDDPDARQAHADLVDLVDPDAVDWHDDGSLARWVESLTGAAVLDAD